MENKLIYENNIVEINKIYTNALIKILSPLLFEGLVSIYKRSKDLFSENENDKITLEDIFKICLKDVSNLNNYILTKELDRIKEATKSSGYFDNLLKSVVKSYIILLTYNLSKKECILIEEKEHEKVDSVKFIHICYIELARNIFRNPKSFIDYIEENNINDENFDDEYNGKYINMIENVVQKAIYKILPFEKIVNDYLKSDYVKKIDTDEEKKLQDELVNKITNNLLEKVILKQKLLNQSQSNNYLKEPNKLTEQFSDYKVNNDIKQNDSYLQEYKNILLNGGNDESNDKELNKVEEFKINQSNQSNTIKQKEDDEEDKLLKQVLNIGSNNQTNISNQLNNQSNHINQSNHQSNYQSNYQSNHQSLNQQNQQLNNLSQTKTQLDEQIEKDINEQNLLSHQTQQIQQTNQQLQQNNQQTHQNNQETQHNNQQTNQQTNQQNNTQQNFSDDIN